MGAPAESTLDCTTCSNGQMVFMQVNEDAAPVYVECLECLTGYWDPPALQHSFRTEDVDWTSVAAGIEAIESAGWLHLVQPWSLPN